jgi:hypothetical protein
VGDGGVTFETQFALKRLLCGDCVEKLQLARKLEEKIAPETQREISAGGSAKIRLSRSVAGTAPAISIAGRVQRSSSIWRKIQPPWILEFFNIG